jgi:hypothetical protein
MRYSNNTLTEQYEYFMLQALKNSMDFHPKYGDGFTEILQHALREGIEIKLIISSGTSCLTDGPAGYAEAQQVIYDWSQAYLFRMGKKGEGARSLINCILVPQPMLPYIKLADEENKERLMMNQDSFEATNLARMMIGANSYHIVKSCQSETDLCGMETLDRSVHDRFFNAVPFSIKPQLKSGRNPAHDRMPVKLRLSEKVSWLSQERSDGD